MTQHCLNTPMTLSSCLMVNTAICYHCGWTKTLILGGRMLQFISIWCTFACTLLDCKHFDASHSCFLHGWSGTGTARETGQRNMYMRLCIYMRHNPRNNTIHSVPVSYTPPVGEKAATDMAWAITSRCGACHTISFSRLPWKWSSVHKTILLTLGSQWAAGCTAMRGVLPCHMTLTVTPRYRTPAVKGSD